MNGLQLTGMEASDMLDVIHYLFEEDSTRYESGEQVEAVSKTREVLYREMYGIEYKFVVNRKNQSNKYNTASGFDDDFDNIAPFDPNKKRPVKPYIPPTQIDPESGMLMDRSGLLEPPLR